MNDCVLSLCGHVELTCAGDPSGSRRLGSKGLALLAYLALEARPHSRDELTALLWGEFDEEKARDSFRQALHQLRAVLGDGIQADRAQVTLTAPLSCDVLDFLRAVEVDPAAAIRTDIPRFFDGFVLRNCPEFDEWVDSTRRTLRRRLAQALAALSKEAFARHDWRTTIELGERWRALEPLSEPATRLLVEAHHQAGGRSVALAAYARFRDHLRAERGTEPGAALQELARRIGAVREPTPRSVTSVAAGALLLPVLDGALRGRAGEWERLRAAWASVRGGHPAVTLIAGEAGAGKSRLAGDFARWVAADGGSVLSMRATEAGRGIPLAPIVELLRNAIDAPGVAGVDPMWLSEVAQLVPELTRRWPGIPAPAPATPIDRWRMFEGVAQLLIAIAEEEPLAIFVDDLHWCDADSCALLHFLVQRLEQAEVLWCMTLTLGVSGRDSAAEVLERALRASATEMVLAPLGEDDVAALVQELGHLEDATGSAGFARALHATTAGNAFYIFETLRSLFAEGRLRVDSRSGEWTAPAGWSDRFELPDRPALHPITAQHIGTLSEEMRELLLTLAVADDECPVGMLSHVHGISRLRVCGVADALVERHLAVESAGRYRCAHPLVAHILRRQLNTARRREVHRAIALALEAVADAATRPGEIARHAEQAGELSQAHRHALAASEGALQRQSYEDALIWLRLAARAASTTDEIGAVERATPALMHAAGWPEMPSEGPAHERPCRRDPNVIPSERSPPVIPSERSESRNLLQAAMMRFLAALGTTIRLEVPMRRPVHSLLALLLALPLAASAQPVPTMRFAVTFPGERSAAPIDGRLLLIISADTAGEPRFQVSDATSTAQVFGVDVEGWKPGETRYVDASAFGYPIASLADLPRGRYRVQALVNRYETFRRADGHTVKLPPDRGEGQQWSRKPGNLHSSPRAMLVDPRLRMLAQLSLDNEIPPVDDFAKKETKYVKYLKIRSERLSKFWGRDTHIAAWVLLPWGFDEHPDARYPLVVNHGHFPSEVGDWRETPPDTTLKPDYSERFHLSGYNRIQQQLAWQFHNDWTGRAFPAHC